MGQEHIRHFTSASEYDAFMQTQRDALKQRNIEDAMRRARAPQRQVPRVFAPKVERSYEEVRQYVEDVLSRRDVEQANQHARRYARTIRVMQGGSPGLKQT